MRKLKEKGLGYVRIARIFKLSPSTVRWHLNENYRLRQKEWKKKKGKKGKGRKEMRKKGCYRGRADLVDPRRKNFSNFVRLIALRRKENGGFTSSELKVKKILYKV